MSAHRFTPALAAACLVVATVLAPGHAGATEIGAGPTTSSPVHPLERVGDRFVRGDVFTGDGRAAPWFVPEWNAGSLR